MKKLFVCLALLLASSSAIADQFVVPSGRLVSGNTAYCATAISVKAVFDTIENSNDLNLKYFAGAELNEKSDCKHGCSFSLLRVPAIKFGGMNVQYQVATLSPARTNLYVLLQNTNAPIESQYCAYSTYS